MHLRQIQSNMSLPIIVKIDQFGLNVLIVQKSKFVFFCRDALINARLIIKTIIITQIVLVDDLVHHFTTFAAKYLFFQVYLT